MSELVCTLLCRKRTLLLHTHVCLESRILALHTAKERYVGRAVQRRNVFGINHLDLVCSILVQH